MNIKTYLSENGVTQSEFADLLGVTQGAVHQWTKPGNKVSPKRAIQISRLTEGKLSKETLRPDIFGELAKTA